MTYDTRLEVAFLEDWAKQNGCEFKPDGEVGFGRECVGITTGSEYPSYEDYDPKTGEATYACGDANPPPEVQDAYHKHPCLAVLGRGPEAIHQLFLWVVNLSIKGVVVERRPRKPTSALDLAFHGWEIALLVNSNHVG
jgi:hypothetical protein